MARHPQNGPTFSKSPTKKRVAPSPWLHRLAHRPQWRKRSETPQSGKRKDPAGRIKERLLAKKNSSV
jgi:hypothetical protein